MYVWHKEARSRKFLVLRETPRSYEVDAGGGALMTLPKDEYCLCTPPEPDRRWHNVTGTLTIRQDARAATLPDDRGILLLNPFAGRPDSPPLRLSLVEDVLRLEEFS